MELGFDVFRFPNDPLAVSNDGHYAIIQTNDVSLQSRQPGPADLQAII